MPSFLARNGQNGGALGPYFIPKLLGVVAFIAIVTFARVYLTAYVGQFVGIFIFFYATVAIVAWLWGFWIGVIASTLSAIAIVSFFLNPGSGALAASPWNLFSLIVFFLVSLMLSWLGEVRLRHIRLLEQMERQREEFVTIASHELRSPLSVLKLDIEHLQRHIGTPNGADERELVAEMGEQVVHMEHLIGDLLDAAKIRQGIFTYRDELLPIEQVVRSAAQAAAEVSGSAVEVEGHVRGLMRGDREKIRQIFMNILSNAIKYSPEGAPVSVILRKSSRFAEVEIRDRGRGIAPEEAKKIFEPFFRAGGVKGDGGYQGLGLGLFVTRLIVQHYRGKIRITSKVGEGTTVVISLPLASDGDRAAA